MQLAIRRADRTRRAGSRTGIRDAAAPSARSITAWGPPHAGSLTAQEYLSATAREQSVPTDPFRERGAGDWEAAAYAPLIRCDVPLSTSPPFRLHRSNADRAS